MKAPWRDVIDRVSDATGTGKEAIADTFQAAMTGESS